MSFLLSMMSRGMPAQGRRTSATELLDLILERRRMAAADGDALSARMGFEAELAGDLPLAAERYQSAACANPPRWVLQRAACVALAQGKPQQAADLYGRLRESAADLLIRAELLLVINRAAEAAGAFRSAICRILDADPTRLAARPANDRKERLMKLIADATQHSPGRDRGLEQIESLVSEGAALLRNGRYVLARERLEQALRTVDLLLSGQAGWIVAEMRGGGATDLVETLVPLVRLSDALLRYLARTALASSLADSLRSRHLREDLAVWATGVSEVTSLLRRERDRLATAVDTHPDHAEANYRLGLLHRALGELPAAAAAFRRVLAVQPFFTRAVVRLAVTAGEMGEEVTPILASGFNVPAATLVQYYNLALATTDMRRFDKAVASLARDVGAAQAPAARANLAFALAELGLLDETRREWREPQAAATA